MSVERVEWLDSGSFYNEGWSSKEEVLGKLKISTVISVGIVMHETTDTLYLALSYDPDGSAYYGVQAISKDAILSREELSTAPEARHYDSDQAQKLPLLNPDISYQ